MLLSRTNDRSRVLNYLSRHASQLIVEGAQQIISEGRLRECSVASGQVTGIVESNSQDPIGVMLKLVDAHEVLPTCSASICASRSQEDSGAQNWCAHSAAVFLHAADLGFLSSELGFPGSRRDMTNPLHDGKLSKSAVIAQLLEELALSSRAAGKPKEDPQTAVEIRLEACDNRLLVQVLFDHIPQQPTVIGDLAQRSSRLLDTLLIEMLCEHGTWDDDERCWSVEDGASLAQIFGLLIEFKSIKDFSGRSALRIDSKQVNLRLRLIWSEKGADVTAEFIDAGGQALREPVQIIGDGPCWAMSGTIFYPLSEQSCRFAALFSRAGTLSLPFDQIGPLVEILSRYSFSPELVLIENPQAMPNAEVGEPRPIFSLSKRAQEQQHFARGQKAEIAGTLEFRYPLPSQDHATVILPNLARERECFDLIQRLGFEPGAETNQFYISGDAALDFVAAGEAALPPDWSVVGFEQLRNSIKLVNCEVELSVQPFKDAYSQDDSRPSAAKKAGKPALKTDLSAVKIDWFDCSAQLTINQSKVPFSTLFKAIGNDAERWVRLDSGAFARVPGGSIAQLKTILGMLDVNYKLAKDIKSRIPLAAAFGLSNSTADRVKIYSHPALQQFSEQLSNFKGLKKIKTPAKFKGSLRSYQSSGLSWLVFLNQFRLGGILADEMGLGKTVQTLALLAWMKQRRSARKTGSTRPSLVVAPTSVITNWLYEARRFAPQLKVLLLHGSERRSNFSDIAEHDLVITSYALLRRDRYELERVNFDYLILDEAQHIKNPQAATTLAAKSLKANWRLALSGTPTENRPLELWSIVDFLMPGFLGSFDFFRTHIERPILERGIDSGMLEVLRTRVRPFILRRTKAQVEKQLPPKIESVLHVAMTDSQRELYSTILAEVRPKVFESVQKRGLAGATVSILAALLRLRQVCNHPNSIEALRNISGYDSGKFILLQELLDEALGAGRKVLLFGQFREMLAIIRRHLEQQGIEYLYLDGTTRDRQSLVDRFNSDQSVRLFLISLKAGGLGLNLTAADTVIIYDPWWNPAVEQQAVDRAHRIGQTKAINVYRLVTEDSVEQKIMDLKKRKSGLVDALMSEADGAPLKLTKSDLEGLFAPIAIKN